MLAPSRITNKTQPARTVVDFLIVGHTRAKEIIFLFSFYVFLSCSAVFNFCFKLIISKTTDSPTLNLTSLLFSWVVVNIVNIFTIQNNKLEVT